MKAAIEAGEFLESAEFSGNMYGTRCVQPSGVNVSVRLSYMSSNQFNGINFLLHSKQAVRNVRNAGKVCVLDIEIEGVKQVRASDLDPVLVFVMPPSIDELKRRLTDRKTETPESLKKRLDTAHREIEYGKQQCRK